MNKITGSFELQPSYGRDYKNKADVEAAFRAGKDFDGDFQLGFKPINIEAFAPGSVCMLRYASNTKVHVVKV